MSTAERAALEKRLGRATLLRQEAERAALEAAAAARREGDAGARRRAADARQRADRAVHEVLDLREAIEALDASAALRERAAVLRAAASGGDGDAVARLELLAAEGARVEEVHRLAETADRQLTGLVEVLAEARGWATGDVLGGGLTDDEQKYLRLEAAAGRARRCGVVLTRLVDRVGELDAEVPGLPAIGLPRPLVVVDRWFDNPFADAAVRGRVDEMLGETEAALDAVRSVAESLEARRAGIETEAAASRARLPGAGPGPVESR